MYTSSISPISEFFFMATGIMFFFLLLFIFLLMLSGNLYIIRDRFIKVTHIEHYVDDLEETVSTVRQTRMRKRDNVSSVDMPKLESRGYNELSSQKASKPKSTQKKVASKPKAKAVASKPKKAIGKSSAPRKERKSIGNGSTPKRRLGS